MIKEYDVVKLTEPLPEEGLEAGDVGAVVMIYDEGAGFEVEFMTVLGDTIAVATVFPHQIEPVGVNDMSHVRQLVS